MNLSLLIQFRYIYIYNKNNFKNLRTIKKSWNLSRVIQLDPRSYSPNERQAILDTISTCQFYYNNAYFIVHYSFEHLTLTENKLFFYADFFSYYVYYQFIIR